MSVKLTCFWIFFLSLSISNRHPSIQSTNEWSIIGQPVVAGHVNWAITSAVMPTSFTSTPPPTSALLQHQHRQQGRRVSLAYLLLMAGIESNPGPALQAMGGEGGGFSVSYAGGRRKNIAGKVGVAKVGAGKVGRGRVDNNNGLFWGLLNVRSAVNKAAVIQDMVASENLDILILTETHIAHNAPPAISHDIVPEGYSVIHAPRFGRKKTSGGGIAVLYRNTLDITRLNGKFINVESSETLAVKVVVGKRRINVLAVYRPPPRATEQFFQELTILCDNFESLPGDFILCGDFNAPGESPTSIDDRLQELLADRGYLQHIKEPTRKTSSSSTDNLLDLVISKFVVNVDRVINIDFTDHRLIKFKLDVMKPVAQSITFTSRDLSKLDMNQVNKLLSSSPISVSPPDDVDDYVAQLDSDVLTILDKLAPLQTRTKRAPSRRKAAWYTPAAHVAKTLSRKLERHYKSTGKEEDYVKWRKAARASVKEMNTARSQYYSDTVREAVSPQHMWKTVQMLLRVKPRAITQSCGDAQLAASFASFFVNKIHKIKSEILTRLTNTAASLIDDPYLPLTSFSSFGPVTTTESARLISSLSSGKSSPIDTVPLSLLKSCKIFAKILTEIANRSFVQGKFPTAFKEAQITPLLKKPNLDPHDPASYRPISNLRTMSKLLERLVQSRLRPHLTSSCQFSSRQAAYRPSHSTETVMVRLTNDLLASSLSGSPSVVVTLDLSAAFDCVNHSKLMNRLSTDFGVSGSALSWIESYLSSRKQFVKVGKEVAKLTDGMEGVPQGSVLGPLFFTTYVSPVSRLIDTYGINHVSYADDITLYANLGSNATDTLARMNNCTTAVSNWFMLNDMLLNPSKSEVLRVGTITQLKKWDGQGVIVAGESMTICDSVKVLGVTIDCKLSFDKHIGNICSATYFHLQGLKHIRKNLDKFTANSVACSIIGSRLDYCNAILAGVSEHSISRLQRVQNSAARVVLNVGRRSSATSSLRELHWLPVSHRIDFKVSLLTFKALRSNEPSYLRSMLVTHVPLTSTRSSTVHSLVQPFCDTAFASRAFNVFAPRLWNKLPSALRYAVIPNSQSLSVNSFKRSLKTLHFKSAFSSDLLTM